MAHVSEGSVVLYVVFPTVDRVSFFFRGDRWLCLESVPIK